MKSFRFSLFVSVVALTTLFGFRRAVFAAEACVPPNVKLVSGACESTTGWVDTKLGCGLAGEPVEKGSPCVCCKPPSTPTSSPTPSTGLIVEPVSPAASKTQAVAPTIYLNALCFTQDQCTSPDYGGSIERFIKGQGCPEGQGKCLAPETEVELSFPILGQKTVQGFRAFVFLLFRFALNILVITTAVVFVWAGFRYIFGASFGDIQAAKEWMVNATVGLLLAFGAILILRTLNPATTRFEALPIFLINKQEFSFISRCADIKSKAGKEVKLAYAGQPVGQIPFSSDPKKFTIPGETTECGKDYYVQGTSGQTCKGSICKDKDKICNVCAGLTHPGGEVGCAGKTTKDFACLKTQFAGAISWASYTNPFYVVGIPVCGWAQPADVSEWNLNGVTNNILLDIIYGVIYAPSKEASGITPYRLPLTETMVSGWESSCKGKGGFKGIVLGVVYNDNCGFLTAGAKFLEQASKGGVVNTIGGAYEAISCKTSDSDIVIVTKQDCTNSGIKSPFAPFFSGYRTVSVHGAGFLNTFFAQPDMVKFRTQLGAAMYTGWRIYPRKGPAEGGTTHRFDKLADNTPQDPYWSATELRQAIKFEKPVQCNFELNQTNAPRDPSEALMSSFLITNDVERQSGGNWVMIPRVNPL